MNESNQKEAQKLDRALVRINRAIERGVDKLASLENADNDHPTELGKQRIAREIYAINHDGKRLKETTAKLAVL